jgi:hypothetical protein
MAGGLPVRLFWRTAALQPNKSRRYKQVHTLMMLSGGFILLCVFLGFGYWRGRLARAALWFIPAWLVVSLVNMSVGVLHAGYSWLDELPFLLMLFLPLAAIALLIWLKKRG